MNYIHYPYMPDMNMPMMNNKYQELESKINRMERQIQRLEQKVAKLEKFEMKPLSSNPSNSLTDNSSIYMV